MVIKDSLYVIYDGHESQDKERETERLFLCMAEKLWSASAHEESACRLLARVVARDGRGGLLHLFCTKTIVLQ